MVTVAIILLVIALACLAAAVMSVIRYVRTKAVRYVFFGVVLLIAGCYTGGAARVYGAPLQWRLHPSSLAGSGPRIIPPAGGGGRVRPVNKPDDVAGQTVTTGYEVGESVIYPGSGGYSILADPTREWTVGAKTAYVGNHQAGKDLAAFLASPYADSPAVRQAEQQLGILSGSDFGSSGPVAPSAVPATAGSFRFRSGTYFTVSGNQHGGFVADGSMLVTGPGHAFGTNLEYPYRYAGWRPLATVYDIPDPKVDVDLGFTWQFSGLWLAVSHPPGVTSGGGYYQWDSGPQYTWCYTFAGKPGFISSLAWLPTQTGTTCVYGGSVTVIRDGAAFAGPFGAGRDGLGSDGVSVTNQSSVTSSTAHLSLTDFIDLVAILIICLCVGLFRRSGNPYFKLMAWAYVIQVISGSNVSLGLDNNLSLLPLPPTHWADVISAWFAVTLPLFLVLQAALAYRERWENRGEGATLGRLTSLFPAVGEYRFLLMLIGLPAIYAVLRGLIFSHTGNAFSHPQLDIIDTASQAVGMFLLVLTACVTQSLFKAYKISLFRYFHATYLAMILFWVFQTVFALYVHWITAADPANQVYVINHFIASPGYVVHSAIATAYALAVPLVASLAFLDYGESRRESPLTVDPYG